MTYLFSSDRFGSAYRFPVLQETDKFFYVDLSHRDQWRVPEIGWQRQRLSNPRKRRVPKDTLVIYEPLMSKQNKRTLQIQLCDEWQRIVSIASEPTEAD